MDRLGTLRRLGVAALTVLGSIGCGASAGGAAGASGSSEATSGTGGEGAPRGDEDPTPIRATDLAVGSAHTCALLEDSSVVCWGAGESGQLGDGRSGKDHARSVPVRVADLSGVTSIRAGVNTTCAIVGSGGGIRCWGDGRFGQLGNGRSGEDYFEPLPVVAAAEEAVDLDVAGPNACAVFRDGSVRCWGRNAPDDLLGFSSPDCGPYRAPAGDMSSMLKPIPCESSPRLIPSLYGAVHVASGGSHSCALVSDGAVRCWGADSYGQLGDGLSGNGNHNSIPSAVAGLSAVSTLAVGAAHTCAVLADKTARCWGDNSFGQLGLGLATLDSYKTEPTPVPGLESVVDLRAAIHTTCVTLADQTVQCWGDTSGLFKAPLASTDGNALKPTPIPDLARALSVRTAGAHACVRETDNTVACWGRNEHGELGNGSVGTFDYTLKNVAF